MIVLPIRAEMAVAALTKLTPSSAIVLLVTGAILVKQVRYLVYLYNNVHLKWLEIT